jgi:hypothetical protein
MYRRGRIHWALGLLAIAWASAALAKGKVDADGWEQIADKENVQVYRRSVPGSKLKSMRGVGLVGAPVATVALVLLDDDRAPEWVDSLAESRVVRVSSPYEYIEYNHVAMPPLIRDREFVTRVLLNKNPAEKTAIIDSSPIEDPAIKHTKIIRGELTAHYVLKSIDQGKNTLLTIEIHTDPKGLLPAWVVNLFQKDWARITIAGIRKQVKKPDLKPPAFCAQYLSELTFVDPTPLPP